MAKIESVTRELRIGDGFEVLKHYGNSPNRRRELWTVESFNPKARGYRGQGACKLSVEIENKGGTTRKLKRLETVGKYTLMTWCMNEPTGEEPFRVVVGESEVLLEHTGTPAKAVIDI